MKMIDPAALNPLTFSIKAIAPDRCQLIQAATTTNASTNSTHIMTTIGGNHPDRILIWRRSKLPQEVCIGHPAPFISFSLTLSPHDRQENVHHPHIYLRAFNARLYFHYYLFICFVFTFLYIFFL